MKINTNAIADSLDACRCRDLERIIDEAGFDLANARRELELARAVAEALAKHAGDVMREADGLRLERDAAQQEAAGMFGPRLADDDHDRALADLDELGGLAGYIPLEARGWLEEVLHGRDAAAVWLAGELREAVAG